MLSPVFGWLFDSKFWGQRGDARLDTLIPQAEHGRQLLFVPYSWWVVPLSQGGLVASVDHHGCSSIVTIRGHPAVLIIQPVAPPVEPNHEAHGPAQGSYDCLENENVTLLKQVFNPVLADRSGSCRCWDQEPLLIVTIWLGAMGHNQGSGQTIGR